MPLYVSVAMIRDNEQQRIFNHVVVLAAKTEEEAIERAKADLARHHAGKEMLSGSLHGVDPGAVREAYAELPPESLQ